MTTFIFPVSKTITTFGHLKVNAENLELAKKQVQAFNQEQIARAFSSHYSDDFCYQIQQHDKATQQLFGG